MAGAGVSSRNVIVSDVVQVLVGEVRLWVVQV